MAKDKVIYSAKATCHKEDNFDYFVGSSLALERLFVKLYKHNVDRNKPIVLEKVGCEKDSRLEVGDIVKVINDGWQYSHYIEWFKEHNLNELSERFAYGINIKDYITNYSNRFKIIAEYNNIYVIEATNRRNCFYNNGHFYNNGEPLFLIHKNGIKKI